MGPRDKYGLYTIDVFDGPRKPAFKRGKRVTGTHNTQTPVQDFQRLLDIFGIPWLSAAGEAEAELADMNARGRIDAILTDGTVFPIAWMCSAHKAPLTDADVWLFGAKTVIQNSSEDLSGTKRLKRMASALASSNVNEGDGKARAASPAKDAPKNPVFQYRYQ